MRLGRSHLAILALTVIVSGYICISLPGERLDELNLPMMVAENQDPRRTAYAVTVDYKHGKMAATAGREEG